MSLGLVYGAARLTRGYNSIEDFLFTLTASQHTASSSGTPGTQRDMNVNSFSGVTVDSVFSVSLAGGTGPVFTNLTPAVATVSANDGQAVYVSNGIAKLQAVDGKYGTRIVESPVSRNASGSTVVFTSYQAASLAFGWQNGIDGAIASISWGPTTVDVFTTNDLHQNALRNSQMWAYSNVDLTAIPIGRKSAGKYTKLFNGCMVSPRHLIFASHAPVIVGDTLYFLGDDDQIQSAVVASLSLNVGGSDIGIAYLNAAVTNITPFIVLPANAYSPTAACALPAAGADAILQGFVYLPLCHFNQNQELLLLDFPRWNASGVDAWYQPCNETNRQAWSKSPASGVTGVYSGDSGSPVFTFLQSAPAPVLLGTCHTTQGFPNVSNYIGQVQAAMNALGGAYTLGQLDISSYPTF